MNAAQALVEARPTSLANMLLTSLEAKGFAISSSHLISVTSSITFVETELLKLVIERSTLFSVIARGEATSPSTTLPASGITNE